MTIINLHILTLFYKDIHIIVDIIRAYKKIIIRLYTNIEHTDIYL